MDQEESVDTLVPAGLQPTTKSQDACQIPTPNYNKLSENLRRVTPDGIQCSLFCGGQRCKYDNADNWDSVHMAIDGIFSHWVTDNILAMARPSSEIIVKRDIIKQFERAGVKTIINLQKPGEHASCGYPLEPSGFTYDPTLFMENDIYFYNFGLNDYGEATTSALLDMVKVVAFALEEGKVAIHCHAGLGRTGVLIACYLVYSLRVRANDAIRFLRLKRPKAVQTRGQILCVQEFEQFILPQTTVFCNKEFVKDRKIQEFNLSQYLLRQTLMLHGYETRIFRYIPKIIFCICERLLQLCSCHYITYETSDVPFTRHFIVAHLNDNYSHLGCMCTSSSTLTDTTGSTFSSTVASASSTRRPSTELNELSGTLSKIDIDEDTSNPNSVACISPDMPSCASEMSGLDDSCLDALLGDGIHKQSLRDNLCYQELSSQLDLRKISEAAQIPHYSVLDVLGALLADHYMLGEGTRKYIRQFRIDINHRQSTWMRLNVERNLYVLTGLLFDWLEHLKVPILSRDELSYIVILGSQPEACLKKLNMATQYIIEYLLRFLSRLQPLSQDLSKDLIKRFVASLTQQGIHIQGNIKPAGRCFNKLRDGTYKKVMEFMMNFFDMIFEANHPMQTNFPTSPSPEGADELEEFQEQLNPETLS